ncbi:hypothetical protein [Microbulbifer epialgicus]|uniref:Methyltransferase domain-containing protein n=1 Tax=Microbulbifer epialgicus TaxID=393907 RepID=A0ABV4NYC8_9GAMM
MSKVDIEFPDSAAPYIDLQSNGDKYIYEDPPYVDAVTPFLETLHPACCLELGAGIGRMSVYFFKRYSWKNTFYYLQDGDSGSVQYRGIRLINEGEYYNSFDVTREYCQLNGLTHFQVINAIDKLDRKVDFCYSFAAIGFHWHIKLYLSKLTSLLMPSAKLLFELRAPLEAGNQVIESTRIEYQNFFDDQVSYAMNHPQYKFLDVVNLDGYSGYEYKDRSYFLILEKA